MYRKKKKKKSHDQSPGWLSGYVVGLGLKLKTPGSVEDFKLPRYINTIF